MSDEAKPYTMDDDRIDHLRLYGASDADDARIVATVRALDAATARIAELEAERTTVAEMERIAAQAVAADQRRIAELEATLERSEQLCKLSSGPESVHCGSCRVCLRRERDEWKAKAEKTEAALVARHGGEPVELLRELDAARARAEKAEADAARLREALEWAEKTLDSAREAGLLGDLDDADDATQVEFEENMAPIRSALAETPVEPLRERLMRVAEVVFRANNRDLYKDGETLGRHDVADLAAIVDAEMKR